jgi:hypothetical protein
LAESRRGRTAKEGFKGLAQGLRFVQREDVGG